MTYISGRFLLGWKTKVRVVILYLWMTTYFMARAVMYPWPFATKYIIYELHCEGQFGHDKTLSLVSSNYYWHKPSGQVLGFMKRCAIYQCSKGSLTNAKLYYPLHVPDVLWLDAIIDIVFCLPWTQRAIDSILTVVDRVSKLAHFVASMKTIVASDITYPYFKKMVRLHRVLRSIFSDRNTKFISNF